MESSWKVFRFLVKELQIGGRRMFFREVSLFLFVFLLKVTAVRAARCCREAGNNAKRRFFNDIVFSL